MSESDHTVAVIGGGAAGYFAAVNAARMNAGLRVTLFEKSREVLSKVRISGGGRCNVTHHCFDPEQLSSAYPRGGKELRWTLEEFHAAHTVTWFEERGVKLKAEEDGRMFPVTDDSATVIDCLENEARMYGVKVRKQTRITAVRPADDHWQLETGEGDRFRFGRVVIAPGGSSRPAAYDWLAEMGHTIVPPVPSLFTFNFRDKSIFGDLAGISVPRARVSIPGTRFSHTGPVLITHWGLSGPAVLKTSAWAARHLHGQEYRFEVRVNWVWPMKEAEVREVLKELRGENATRQCDKQDRFAIPVRLWKRMLERSTVSPSMRWAELSNEGIHRLTQELTGGTYAIQGKTTYKEEFVTCGGVALGEVNFGTMGSRICQGIHFAGEVLDIDGITGGYNFQSAWTTGWIAARAIAEWE